MCNEHPAAKYERERVKANAQKHYQIAGALVVPGAIALVVGMEGSYTHFIEKKDCAPLYRESGIPQYFCGQELESIIWYLVVFGLIFVVIGLILAIRNHRRIPR